MTNLKITNPCKENWNSMAPNKLGRYCQLCDKTVIDFTKMSPDEIKVYLQKNGRKRICGRIPREPIKTVPSKKEQWFNSLRVKINQCIDDSSYLLGYTKFRTFRKIHFTKLKNSIYLISILIAIEIIKELPITLILRPFNFETFATKAYAYASQDLLEAAALPSLFLIFWSAILIFFTSKHILSEK